MKYLLLVLPLFVLAACGGDDEEKENVKEPVKLESEKDKLSYTLGAKQGRDIANSSDPNVDKFDMDQIAKGFREGFVPGFDGTPANPCIQTLQNLFGANTGATFDESYLKEGCLCMGKLTSGVMYQQLNELGQVDRVNKEILFRGFEDALNKADTVLGDQEKQEILNSFNQEMQALVMQEQQKRALAFESKWEQIKKIPGIKELKNGIYLETLQAGTGGMPGLNSDIRASYILYDFNGKMIQNSKDVTPDGKFTANLSTGPDGVIEGWVIGFQSIRKGGRYKLYIPAAMAYNQEPLMFEVELFDFGPKGSIKK